jgi:hypothetical protein
MSMPKRLDPGAKQGIMTKTHRQTLDGKKHPSFATWGNSGIEPDKGTGNQLSRNV